PDDVRDRAGLRAGQGPPGGGELRVPLLVHADRQGEVAGTQRGASVGRGGDLAAVVAVGGDLEAGLRGAHAAVVLQPHADHALGDRLVGDGELGVVEGVAAPGDRAGGGEGAEAARVLVDLQVIDLFAALDRVTLPVQPVAVGEAHDQRTFLYRARGAGGITSPHRRSRRG